METTIENSMADFSRRLKGFRENEPDKRDLDRFEDDCSEISDRLGKLQEALKKNFFCYSQLFDTGVRYALPSISAIAGIKDVPDDSIEARVRTLVERMRNLMEKGHDEAEMRKISIVFLETRRNLDDLDTALKKIDKDYWQYWNGWYDRNHACRQDLKSEWKKRMEQQTTINF